MYEHFMAQRELKKQLSKEVCLDYNISLPSYITRMTSLINSAVPLSSSCWSSSSTP